MKKNKIFKDSRPLEMLDYLDEAYVAEVVDNLNLQNEPGKPLPKKVVVLRSVRTAAVLVACAVLLGAAVPLVGRLVGMIPDESDLASQFEARRAGEIMNRCLGKLSKDDRRIFVMRYWLSMSYDQIRTQTGFGESKIKMSLSRTRAKLADELKKEGITV